MFVFMCDDIMHKLRLKSVKLHLSDVPFISLDIYLVN